MQDTKAMAIARLVRCVCGTLPPREGGLHVRLRHRIVHHAMAKQLPLSQDVLWTRHFQGHCAESGALTRSPVVTAIHALLPA